MEFNKNLSTGSTTAAFTRLLILLLASICCFSCGSQLIKGRAPFVSISGMNMVDGTLSAVFDVRNQNGVPMTIDMIDITVTVNEVELTRQNSEFSLAIGANSAEEVSVEKLPDDFTRSLLASLDSGEVKSLPFKLKGRVHTTEDGYLAFDHKGYLYPVPGKPGYFRSAVTQAKGLKREDRF